MSWTGWNAGSWAGEWVLGHEDQQPVIIAVARVGPPETAAAQLPVQPDRPFTPRAGTNLDNGGHVPTAVVVENVDGSYLVVDWPPRTTEAGSAAERGRDSRQSS